MLVIIQQLIIPFYLNLVKVCGNLGKTRGFSFFWNNSPRVYFTKDIQEYAIGSCFESLEPLILHLEVSFEI
jgi:hypothetical protein